MPSPTLRDLLRERFAAEHHRTVPEIAEAHGVQLDVIHRAMAEVYACRRVFLTDAQSARETWHANLTQRPPEAWASLEPLLDEFIANGALDVDLDKPLA